MKTCFVYGCCGDIPWWLFQANAIRGRHVGIEESPIGFDRIACGLRAHKSRQMDGTLDMLSRKLSTTNF
jgi:hypothetical protein